MNDRIDTTGYLLAPLLLLAACSGEPASGPSDTGATVDAGADTADTATADTGSTTCDASCTPGATSCTFDNKVVLRCTDADGDGCPEWVKDTSCNDTETCDGGACVATCTDDCESSDATRCGLNGLRTCGDHDDDACLEWSDPEACADGESCRDGGCRPERGSALWAAKIADLDDRGTGPADAAVAPSGAIYVTGRYPSTAYFDGTKYEPTNDHRSDAYIAKFDTSGAFQWVHTFGGDNRYFRDQGTGIVVDDAGTVYATGRVNRKFTVDGQQFDTEGTPRMYLFELDPSGTLQSTNFYDSVRPQALVMDGAGDLYATGHHHAPNSTLKLDDDGVGGDMFVVKLNTAGDLIWSTKPDRAPDRERSWDVAVDDSGRVAVTGTYEGDVEVRDNLTFSHSSEEEMFVLALAADGSVRWGTTFRTDGVVRGRALDVDSSGALYVGGEFGGEVTFDGTTVRPNGSFRDAYVASWTADGDPRWIRTFGGADELDRADALTVGPDDHLFVGGQFRADADFGDGPVSARHSYDGFVASYDAAGNYRWQTSITSQNGGQRVNILQTRTDRLLAFGMISASTTIAGTTLDPAPHSFTQFMTELAP